MSIGVTPDDGAGGKLGGGIFGDGILGGGIFGGVMAGGGILGAGMLTRGTGLGGTGAGAGGFIGIGIGGIWFTAAGICPGIPPPAGAGPPEAGMPPGSIARLLRILLNMSKIPAMINAPCCNQPSDIRAHPQPLPLAVLLSPLAP